MDPSGTDICKQGHCTIDQSNVKRLPLTVASSNTSQNSSRVPIAEDKDGGMNIDCGLQPSGAESRERKTEKLVAKTKEQRGWRRIIRNFTPS